MYTDFKRLFFLPFSEMVGVDALYDLNDEPPLMKIVFPDGDFYDYQAR